MAAWGLNCTLSGSTAEGEIICLTFTFLLSHGEENQQVCGFAAVKYFYVHKMHKYVPIRAWIQKWKNGNVFFPL